MTRENIECIAADEDAGAVLTAMKRRVIRRIPVTDTDGRLVGVVAQADVAVADGIPRENVADVVRKVSEPARPER